MIKLILYKIGWMLDKILILPCLILLYPFIFITIYKKGYLSLKDKKFKGWKGKKFPSNYFNSKEFLSKFGWAIFISEILILTLIFRSFAIIYILLMLMIAILFTYLIFDSLYIYYSKKHKNGDKNDSI